MAKCAQCGTVFTFNDVLKSLNPTKIKCRGCSTPIKTSVPAFAAVFCVFLVVVLGFWWALDVSDFGAQIVMFLGLLVVSLVAEYAYYWGLVKGKISSELSL